MSHLTTVKTKVTDLNAAKSALQEMGFAVLEGGTVHGGGRTQQVAATIDVPGQYKLGFVQQDDGNFDIVGDWYYANRHVGGQPQFMARFQQLYGVHKATQEAQLRGFLVERETDENGLIRLTLTEP